jgi:hypothetical protein
MVVFNNQTISRIEGSANQAMQRITDGKFLPQAPQRPLTTLRFPFFSNYRMAFVSALEAKKT